MEDEDKMFSEEETDAGDEFMAVKPWVGAIKEPTYSYFKDKSQHLPPPVDIVPDYVYGYRTKD